MKEIIEIQVDTESYILNDPENKNVEPELMLLKARVGFYYD